MNVQDIRLDIDKKTGVAQWVTIGQGDKGGTTIRATVFDNDVAAALTGMSARFEMRMPNATYFEDTNCTINGNVITYVVDESHAALYAGGESVAYFALYDGETAIYSTERFHVRVARAASDGANPGRAWTNGIEEWLDDASDTLDDYVADANSRVGATINAANAAVEGMRSDVDESISDTEDVIDRAEDAIEAMEDISEHAVPLMSKDVRGGAKLEEHGGLALRDGALGIGSLVQQSDGYARGGLAEVTAKGHAEQDGTPTPDNPVPIQVVRGRNLFDGVINNTAVAGSSVVEYSSYCSFYYKAKPNTTYTISRKRVTGNRFRIYSANTEPVAGTTVSAIVESDTALSVTITTPSDTEYVYVYLANDGSTIDTEIQAELGDHATPYVPHGYAGMEAQGRNLWGGEKMADDIRNAVPTDAKDSDSNGRYVEIRAVSDGHFIRGIFRESTRYTLILTARKSNTDRSTNIVVYYTDGSYQKCNFPTTPVVDTIYTLAFTTAEGKTVRDVGCGNYSGTTFLYYDESGLFEGIHIADDFEPYFHTTTTIPLPQRGWVAGLPDGTADSLRLDGAGKCEWELADAETTTAATDGVTGTIGVDVLSTTGQIADGATVLYKLATPVTEDCGYVEDWPTDLPEGTTVTIPELDEVGIRYFVDSAVTELAQQWYEKSRSEYEDRLASLEDTVAQLIAEG